MTTKRAAKYLNGADIGKKFSIKGWPTPRTILDIRHLPSRVSINCSINPATNDRTIVDLSADHEVTIYTPPSPPTTDPHGIRALSPGKAQPVLDLSTPEKKADAREALPALLVGGMLGNEQASRAAGEIIGDVFADALKPSIEALQRLTARKEP